ncbi:hypothetical protein FLL45_07075 [Aliikangiella marina]|uniref:Peptidase C-terminal archaeal/bacterial domain-containing protein n=1 Tax=Aliikangiella marina TaxID=1712262 RepID=A0A545TBX6_9GAMM|nr:hypothetical protein [Aliikangiella marina]TQV74717.1 hypothetical protein FLL45_07075 [Aliikangiella marina]
MRFRVVALSFALGLVILFAGCGGSSDDAAQAPEQCFRTSVYYCPQSVWGDPFGIALVFAWYSGQCTREVGCSADLPQTDASQGIIREEFIAANWTITNAQESEPNNSFDDALPLVLNQETVFSITGTLNDSNDTRDTVAAGFLSSNLHAIYICRGVNDCLLPFYQGNAFHIEFYDQNQNLIESSFMNQTNNGHEITFTPQPGLYYFVAIVADDTQGEDMAYELVITD